MKKKTLNNFYGGTNTGQANATTIDATKPDAKPDAEPDAATPIVAPTIVFTGPVFDATQFEFSNDEKINIQTYAYKKKAFEEAIMPNSWEKENDDKDDKIQVNEAKNIAINEIKKKLDALEVQVKGALNKKTNAIILKKTEFEDYLKSLQDDIKTKMLNLTESQSKYDLQYTKLLEIEKKIGLKEEIIKEKTKIYNLNNTGIPDGYKKLDEFNKVINIYQDEITKLGVQKTAETTIKDQLKAELDTKKNEYETLKNKIINEESQIKERITELDTIIQKNKEITNNLTGVDINSTSIYSESRLSSTKKKFEQVLNFDPNDPEIKYNDPDRKKLDIVNAKKKGIEETRKNINDAEKMIKQRHETERKIFEQNLNNLKKDFETNHEIAFTKQKKEFNELVSRKNTEKINLDKAEQNFKLKNDIYQEKKKKYNGLKDFDPLIVQYNTNLVTAKTDFDNAKQRYDKTNSDYIDKVDIYNNANNNFNIQLDKYKNSVRDAMIEFERKIGSESGNNDEYEEYKGKQKAINFIKINNKIKQDYNKFLELYTTYMTIFNDPSSGKLKESGENLIKEIQDKILEGRQLNNHFSLVKNIDNRTLDDYLFYFFKQFYEILQISSKLDNTVDDIVNDTTNNFTDTTKNNLKILRRRIFILDINVINAKLKDLKNEMTLTYNKNTILLLTKEIDYRNLKINNLEKQYNDNIKEIKKLKKEITQLEKLKDTLNDKMNNLVDSFSENINLLSELLRDKDGDISKQDSKSSSDFVQQYGDNDLNNIKLDMLETVLIAVSKDKIDEDINNITTSVIAPIPSQVPDKDFQTTFNKLIDGNNKIGGNNNLIGGYNNLIGSGECNTYCQIITFYDNMNTLLNNKEFHLLFTIMSEQDSIKILYKNICSSNDKFYKLLLNCLFVDININEQDIVQNKIEIQKIIKRDKEYYNFCYNATKDNEISVKTDNIEVKTDNTEVKTDNKEVIVNIGASANTVKITDKKGGSNSSNVPPTVTTDVTTKVAASVDLNSSNIQKAINIETPSNVDTYLQEQKNPIFYYTYLQLLKDKKIPEDKYYKWDQVVKLAIIKYFKKFLSEPLIFKHLKTIYTELISRLNPVVTIVKERCDTGAYTNPRYVISEEEIKTESYNDKIKKINDKKIKIEYYNTNKKIKFEGALKIGDYKISQQDETFFQKIDAGTQKKNINEESLNENKTEYGVKETYHIGPVNAYFKGSVTNKSVSQEPIIYEKVTKK